MYAAKRVRGARVRDARVSVNATTCSLVFGSVGNTLRVRSMGSRSVGLVGRSVGWLEQVSVEHAGL